MNLNNSLIFDGIDLNQVLSLFIEFLHDRSFWEFLVEPCWLVKYRTCFRNLYYCQTDVVHSCYRYILSLSQHFHCFSIHDDIVHKSSSSGCRISAILVHHRFERSIQNIGSSKHLHEDDCSSVASATLEDACLASMAGTRCKEQHHPVVIHLYWIDGYSI